MEPGFVNDLFSAFYPFAFSSPAITQLNLADYGLRWCRAPLVLRHPSRDRTGPGPPAPPPSAPARPAHAGHRLSTRAVSGAAPGTPPPGDTRLSKFLLWQSAYAELCFVDTLWPDFGREKFMACLANFAPRERRFGAVSDAVA